MNSRINSYSNCVINVWSRTPEQRDVEDLERACLETAKEHDDSVVLLVVVLPGRVPILNADQRQWLEDFYQRVAPYFVAVAQTVEGTNLWSVTARSVMTALRLVQRRAYPLRVFSDVDESIEWIAESVTCPEGMTTEDVTKKLRETFEKLREQHQVVAS